MVVENFPGATYIKIERPLTFMGYLKVKRTADQLSHTVNKIIIDLSRVTYIDHTVLKKLQTLRNELQGAKRTVEENHALLPIYDYPLSVRGQQHIA